MHKATWHRSFISIGLEIKKVLVRRSESLVRGSKHFLVKQIRLWGETNVGWRVKHQEELIGKQKMGLSHLPLEGLQVYCILTLPLDSDTFWALEIDKSCCIIIQIFSQACTPRFSLNFVLSAHERWAIHIFLLFRSSETLEWEWHITISNKYFLLVGNFPKWMEERL